MLALLLHSVHSDIAQLHAELLRNRGEEPPRRGRARGEDLHRVLVAGPEDDLRLGRRLAHPVAQLAGRAREQIEHDRVGTQPARHQDERLRALLLPDHLDAVLPEHVHHAQADHRLEVSQQDAGRSGVIGPHALPASPVRASARQRDGGSRSGIARCPFGQRSFFLAGFAGLAGGLAGPGEPTVRSTTAPGIATSAVASAPSRVRAISVWLPGGTRLSRKRPWWSDEAKSPISGSVIQTSGSGAPSASTTLPPKRCISVIVPGTP